ncbi:MAG: hypothetical protein ABJC10_06160 [Acidobacteriota bacterium]
MKKTIRMISMCATLALLPGLANVITLKAQTPAASPVSAQCTDEFKNASYADFMKFRTTESARAYEASKKYLGCSQTEDQYTTYLKKWNGLYEKEDRKIRFQPLLYGEKKYAEAFALGKAILADDPENLRVIIDLGYSGFQLAAPATKNESFNTDSLNYSRKAIQMIEAGKAPESLDGKTAPWVPFKGKDDTLAYLYRGIGRLTIKSNPGEALVSLIKALQYDTDLKKEPWEYYFVAAAYETGPYPKLSEDYKTRFLGKDETPESKLALANINQIIDRMIDAYARAVALAGNDVKYQTQKKDWTEALSTWYKFRNSASDAGMNEFIASVLSKPLPPVPTPLTTLPAAAPTTSTTLASGTSTTAGSTAAPGAGVPANKPAATAPLGTTPKTTTKTPATTTATTKPVAKPKTRNNHRRP